MRDARTRRDNCARREGAWLGAPLRRRYGTPRHAPTCATIPATMAKRKARRAARRRSARGAGPARKGRLPKDAVTLIVILRAKEGQETLVEAEVRALVGSSAFRGGEVVAGAGADFQIAAVHFHFDFVIAVLAGAGGCVAQRVLGMEFAADFINGLLNRAILEGGEACAAGANGGYLERVVFHGGGDVRDGPQDGIEQVRARVALLLGGGRLHGSGNRWPTERAWGRHGRHARLRLLVEHGASRRETDAI